MPVMDEFREERQSIKDGTPKQKYQYFKDYYRTPLIIAILCIIFIGSLLYQFFTKKDYAFYGILLNSSAYNENEWFLEDFADYAGISTEEYNLMLDSSAGFKSSYTDEETMFTIQKVSTYTGAGDLDILMGAGDAFSYYSNSPMLQDLREVLTEEQIAKYEPYFYYIDSSIQDDIQWVSETGASITPDVPDPQDPDSMQEPVPVGIYVESAPN